MIECPSRPHNHGEQVANAYDPFELFCFYYLGLDPQGQYKFSNANQMARYYKTTVASIMNTLREFELHPDLVVNTDFPLSQYQVEIQLAHQAGEQQKMLAIAEQTYRGFRERIGKNRDWQAEIDREQVLSKGS